MAAGSLSVNSTPARYCGAASGTFGSSNLAQAIEPRKRITYSSDGMLMRTFWLGRRTVGEVTCAPNADRSIDHRRIAVQLHLDAFADAMPRRTARAVPVERRSGAVFGRDGAAGLGCQTDCASPTAASTARGLHDLAGIVAGVRHDPHLAHGELRIALDPIDEGGAARRGGEQALEHDQRRADVR